MIMHYPISSKPLMYGKMLNPSVVHQRAATGAYASHFGCVEIFRIVIGKLSPEPRIVAKRSRRSGTRAERRLPDHSSGSDYSAARFPRPPIVRKPQRTVDRPTRTRPHSARAGYRVRCGASPERGVASPASCAANVEQRRQGADRLGNDHQPFAAARRVGEVPPVGDDRFARAPSGSKCHRSIGMPGPPSVSRRSHASASACHCQNHSTRAVCNPSIRAIRRL